MPGQVTCTCHMITLSTSPKSGMPGTTSNSCGMPSQHSTSSSRARRSLIARVAKRSGIVALITGGSATAWYLVRSSQLVDGPVVQDTPGSRHSKPRSLPSGVQERRVRPDIRLPSSIYGWAADVQTKVSGTFETAQDDVPSTSGRKHAAQLAAEHQDEVAVMRDLLNQKGLSNLPGRLQHSDAELIRYAIACGLFHVDTEPERMQALQRAVKSIQASAKWLEQHRFLSRKDMHPYRNLPFKASNVSETLAAASLCAAKVSDMLLALKGCKVPFQSSPPFLVWWEDLDAEHRPVLMVRLGKAVNESTTKAEADTIAEVIISQIDYGITNFLSDEPGSAEKLVVVLDCREATAFKATKAVRLMKNVAVTLNQHYPSRLHQLFFVEPPAVMKWPIQAAKPLLHADTGNKISVCSLSDPALPIDLTKIPDVW